MALIYDSVVTYIVDNSVKSAGSSSVKSLQGVGLCRRRGIGELCIQ